MKVIEHKSPDYEPRTTANAKSADLTVAFAEDYTSLGEKLTKNRAGEKYLAIPLQTPPIEAARKLFADCRKRGVKTLNVAGNGIYTLKNYGWTQEKLNLWMFEVLRLVHKHHPLDLVISGGQTGVDFAGGIAAELLGLNPIMTFPKGFKQRTLTQYELIQTEGQVMLEVERQLRVLVMESELLPPMPPSKTRAARPSPEESDFSLS